MTKEKVMTVGIFATITSWLGIMAVPVYLLLALNIMDYITGITAAKNRGKQISSYYGMMGIVKKLFMYFLVAIGVFVDIMLRYITANLGWDLILPYICGCVVAIWLVLNEMISILENLDDIGVKMPPFLMPLIKRIRGEVEDKTKIVDDQEDAKIS